MIKLCASVAVLAALAMVGLACGGSSVNSTQTTSASVTATGTEGAYFTPLARIFAGGKTGSDDATTKLNNDLKAAQTLDDNRAAINTFLDSMVGVFSTAITGMQALTPPADASDAHNKFLQDVQNAKTKSSDLKGQLASASTSDDLNTIVDAFNTQVDALVSDANTACVALQDLDHQHGVNVDLSCNGGNAVAQPTGTLGDNTAASAGAIAEADHVRVYLNAIQDPYTSTKQFIQPGTGKRFVAFDVTVEFFNDSGVHSANPFNFGLVDSQSFAYDPTFGWHDPAMTAVDLSPGEKTRGWVTFEVAAGAQLKTLRYQPNPLKQDYIEFNFY